MKLYLAQHGEAMPKEIEPARPLTEKGKSDVYKVAKFLNEKAIKVDIIWHSTKTRAIQTARIFSEVVETKEGIKEKEGLMPNDSVNNIRDELSTEERNLMIVSHLPFLQKLASLLLVKSESYEIIGFCQGGVVCLERKDEDRWHLIWAITPHMV